MPKEETTHKISELIACEEYSVQVATMKDNTTGPFSDGVEGFAGENGELCIHIRIGISLPHTIKIQVENPFVVFAVSADLCMCFSNNSLQNLIHQ